MRKSIKIMAAGVILAGLSSQAVLANNDLYISTNDGGNNYAQITVTGDNSALSVVQSHDGLGDTNALSVSLDGDLNGGPFGAAFGPLAADLGLVPGQIDQTGHGNAIVAAVTGSSNLFAMSQIGSNNSISAVIAGNYNQAAVVQMGAGNSLSFAQHGNGNTLSVVQQSR